MIRRSDTPRGPGHRAARELCLRKRGNDLGSMSKGNHAFRLSTMFNCGVSGGPGLAASDPGYGVAV